MSSKDRGTFELVVQVRDSMGLPTGVTKAYATDSGADLENFWERNSGAKKRRKRSNRKGSGEKQNVRDTIATELDKLTKLERGWDGKSGLPLNYNTCQATLRVIASLTDLIKFKPKISPTSSGGVRLEFSNRRNNTSLDIDMQDQFSMSYLFYDEQTGESEEKQLGINEVTQLRSAFQLMMTKK